MPTIDTPCTKICTLDPAQQICIGCGRNLDEIERWSRLSSEERIRLMAVARERLENRDVALRQRSA